MRTITIIALLLLLLTGCATKEAPVAEKPKEAEATEEVIAVEEVEKIDPVGTFVLKDGSTLELTNFVMLGEFCFHITGKLNGRSSTLIQITRRDDLYAWKGITFESPTTFTIVTRKNKEYRFTDARIYIGSKSDESFSFMTTMPGSYQEEEFTVPKSEVKLIGFTPNMKK